MKKLLSVISVTVVLSLLSSVPTFAADSYIDVDCGSFFDEELILGDACDFTFSMPEYPKLLSDYGDGSYNYGDFLDKNNLAVYNALSVLSTPTQDPISVTLPEAFTFSLSALPNSPDFTEEDNENYSMSVFGNCKPGIDSLIFDMPEIFWIDMTNLNISFGQDTSIKQSKQTGKYNVTVKTLIFTPSLLDSFDSLSEAMEYKELLEEAVDEFPVEGETRYEQIKSIHDQISDFTFYDLESRFSGSALGALVEPGAVCEGYAKAFKLICDRLEIPCVLIFGNYNSETRIAHMWNYVQMENGNWYAIDLTWDDLDDADGRNIKYQYFLKGVESFIKHTPDPDYYITYFNYPELSEYDYIRETEFPYGDLNRDGYVSVADLVYCTNTVLGRIQPEFSCDVDGDGQTNALDIVFIRKLLINGNNIVPKTI